MKTLDQIIDQIHQEQKQHNLKVINERNLYMEELEKKYSSEDFLASHIFDADTEELFKDTKEGFLHPQLRSLLSDYMSPKGVEHLRKFKEALEIACSGSYKKWEANILTKLIPLETKGDPSGSLASYADRFNSLDPLSIALRYSFAYEEAPEGWAYWSTIDDFLVMEV